MSEATQSGGNANPSQGDANNDQTNPGAQPPKKDDVVVDRTAEEYAARLKETSAESRKFRQENAELKRRLEELEQRALAEQGNYKEVAEKTKLKLEETANKLKSATQRFAYKTVAGQVEKEALKHGCIDTDALIKLADLSTLEADEDFNVDPAAVKSLVEDMVKSKAFLFKKPDPKIADGLPPKNGGAGGKKTIDQMTPEEKIAALAATFKQ